MSYRLASRYAKSLIQLAQEKGKLQEVYNDIVLMDNAFESSRELRVFLKSPVVGAEKKLEVMNKLFVSRVSEITGKFIILLTNKGREGELHEIAESFKTQYNVLKGITPVTITSAVKLDKATIDSLLSGLKTREKLTEVELTEVVNADLVGGFILQYGDKQIDSSVRSSLQKLNHLVEDNSYVKNIR
jgi:F-type H+-transporting ATPase subunit delta